MEYAQRGRVTFAIPRRKNENKNYLSFVFLVDNFEK